MLEVVPQVNSSFNRRDIQNRTPEDIAQTQKIIAAKFSAMRGLNEVCFGCKRTVYYAERREVSMNKKIECFHKQCFRCSDCNCLLDVATYTCIDGALFCATHSKSRVDAQNSKPILNLMTDSSPHYIPSNHESCQTNKIKSENSEMIVKKITSLVRDPNLACQSCSKPVYAVEKLEIETSGSTKRLYHKGCFKCSVCSTSLEIRNFGSLKGKLFCSIHLYQNLPSMSKDYFVSPLAQRDENYTSIGMLDNLYSYQDY
eukprot:TRINITY_DN3619_c0_g2_i2.p1 TRINITY_DN3619_c0_g2~~TRINITY_DN3619_c0_g2_i2.p1  ORF type:complete len:257 (-),score=33.06 TRINITY_DN3619_c0_g2_i2:98-868(-)